MKQTKKMHDLLSEARQELRSAHEIADKARLQMRVLKELHANRHSLDSVIFGLDDLLNQLP